MVGKNYGSLWIETENDSFLIKSSYSAITDRKEEKGLEYPVFFLYILA